MLSARSTTHAASAATHLPDPPVASSAASSSTQEPSAGPLAERRPTIPEPALSSAASARTALAPPASPLLTAVPGASIPLAPPVRGADRRPLRVTVRVCEYLARHLPRCHTMNDLIRTMERHCAQRVGRPSANEVAYVIARAGWIARTLPRDGQGSALREFDLDYLNALMTLAPGDFDEFAISDVCLGLRELRLVEATHTITKLWGQVSRRVERFAGPLSADTIVRALLAMHALPELHAAVAAPGIQSLILGLARRIAASTATELTGAQIALICEAFGSLPDGPTTQTLARSVGGLIERSRHVNLTRDDILVACSGLRPIGSSGEPLALALAPILFNLHDVRLDERSLSRALGCLKGLHRSAGARELTNALRRLASVGPWSPDRSRAARPAEPALAPVQWQPLGPWMQDGPMYQAVPAPMELAAWPPQPGTWIQVLTAPGAAPGLQPAVMVQMASHSGPMAAPPAADGEQKSSSAHKPAAAPRRPG